MIEILLRPEVMLALGFLTHILKDVLRVRLEGGKGAGIGLIDYFLAYPIQTAVAAIGALLGMVALHEMGELSALTAYGAGYMSNSVADVVGKRTATKLGAQDDGR